MKKKFKLKPIQITGIALAAVLFPSIIVGDYFAVKYAGPISNFFNTAEQISSGGNNVEEAAKNGDEVVRKLANEGVVLLKNDLNKEGKPTLPLANDKRKINVFGWGATDSGFLYTGNGSGRSYIYPDNKVTFLEGLKEAGFEYNEEIIKIYEDWCTDEDADWGETSNWNNRYSTKLKEPVTATAFPDDVVGRARTFSDTAVIVLSRYSGEYIGRLYDVQYKHDLPTDETRSFNEISTEEISLIKMVTSNFDNVIVVFNTGSIMDMSFIDDEATYGKIGAAMNVGYMGQSGATAIGKILTGEVNPSGKLADTVLYDPKENEISRVNPLSNDIVYAEDIYLGYKFYETADAEGYFDNKVKFGGTPYEKNGYDAVVQYPFGHGLSYTSFSWEVENLSLPENSALTSTSEIKFDVRVTNTGAVAGKDVVELYYTAPYYDGQIEKAEVNLLDFGKTPLLEPGQSSVISFTVTPYDLASYDCYDKNDNGMTGWEVDIGEYQLKLMTDSHHLKEMENNTLTYTVDDVAFRYRKDPVSGGRIKNRFTGDTAYGECPLDGSALDVDWTYLSRSNFEATMPREREEAPSSAVMSAYSIYYYDDYVFENMPVTGVESNLRLVTKDDGSFASYEEFTGEKEGAKLKYNDELMMQLGNPANYNDPIWDEFLNQLTPTELKRLVEDGGYGSRAAESIGKPVNLEYDGPSGFNRTNLSPNTPGSNMTALPCENLTGQTWNKELLSQAGQIIGMDGQNFGISGIYAPGVNLHREALNGRNYEYYSEDGVLSGYLAASFIKGAASNGVYSYIKHLALYDSSPWTNQRVWCTEQNLRENYLRPFEIAIKKGGANAVMVSFNKIGATWSGSNQAMIDGILRTEFGFKGVVVTDYDSGDDSNMVLRNGIRAGLNLQLNPNYGQAGKYGTISTSDTVDMNLARSSAKSMVYTMCNTYYRAKTEEVDNEYSVEISDPKAITKGFNWWVILVVLLNIIFFGLPVLLFVWTYIPKRKKVTDNGIVVDDKPVIVKPKQKNKKQLEEEIKSLQNQLEEKNKIIASLENRIKKSDEK